MDVPLRLAPAASALPTGPRDATARPEPLMWLDTDRVLYVGLAGEPCGRTFGAFSVYASLHKPHRISVDGGPWEEAELSVVPPCVPHSIVCGERMICNVIIEADSVAHESLPAFIANGRGAVKADGALQAMRDALQRLRHSPSKHYADTADFDRAFFGEPLQPRSVDRRIRAVLTRIKQDPNGHASALACAQASHLSMSRFLHLFKAEAGTSFRSFRTWQRARSVLHHVTRDTNLAHIALEAGYPDSTHFSHSIRQVYGLTPRAIFAGSRKLALYACIHPHAASA